MNVVAERRRIAEQFTATVGANPISLDKLINAVLDQALRECIEGAFATDLGDIRTRVLRLEACAKHPLMTVTAPHEDVAAKFLVEEIGRYRDSLNSATQQLITERSSSSAAAPALLEIRLEVAARPAETTLDAVRRVLRNRDREYSENNAAWQSVRGMVGATDKETAMEAIARVVSERDAAMATPKRRGKKR